MHLFTGQGTVFLPPPPGCQRLLLGRLAGSLLGVAASRVSSPTGPFLPLMSPTPVDDAPVLGAFRITGGRSFYDTASVEIIDQLLLPHQEVWEEVSTIEGAFDAIKTMKVGSSPCSRPRCRQTI